VSVLAIVALAAGHAGADVWKAVTQTATGDPLLYPSCLSVFNDNLYFWANNLPHGNNVELYRFDGTNAYLAAEIIPGDTGVCAVPLTEYNGRLYFSTTGPVGGWKLWCYDPVSGASLAPGSLTGPGAPQGMAAYGGYLIFGAASVPAGQTQLWKFDGANQLPIYTPAGNRLVNPQFFREFNGLLYFSAWGPGGQGEELYRTNGTAAALLTDIAPGEDGSQPNWPVVFNSALYFSAYEGPGAGSRGRELWRYTGTEAQFVADIRPGGTYDSSNPNNMAVYKGKMYFSADDGVHGYELWCYDGTSPPYMVVEINPTPDPLNGDTWMMDSSPSWLTVFGGRLYFAADDGVHGRELWAYNADTDAAWMVRDINPGQYGSEVSELTVFDGKLYFSADDGYIPGLRSLEPDVWAYTIPEPATLALAALGALAALARRRGADA
jgi:ELWxxDGT repeat protein